jgi:hypothetical protein
VLVASYARRSLRARARAHEALVAATLAEADVIAASEYAKDLLDPGQQPPRGNLAAIVSDAVDPAASGDNSSAAELLGQAVSVAREFGYT